jgi:chromosomal replication initiation ATPase DnaA
MSQLTFQFPFKTTYYEKDFYVSSNNFQTYKLIEGWPNWPSKLLNIFGPPGCGKTHLSNILKKKINTLIINENDFKNININNLKDKECIIIENFDNNIDENFFYSFLNLINQSNIYLLVNSRTSIKKFKINLKDLKSRLDSFLDVGINLPSDDLLRVILTKSFSEKQIEVNVKVLEYILKHIDRSYEKIFQFVKEIDIESLSTGKSININLIKKVLNK